MVSDSVGCGPDLVSSGLTGEVFETGSDAALVDALKKSFALIGRDEIRAVCRARVAAYSIDKAAEGIARAYEAAIA